MRSKILEALTLLVLGCMILATVHVTAYDTNQSVTTMSFISWVKDLVSGGGKAPSNITTGSAGQYISPYTGQPTNIQNVGGSSLTSSSSYLNPAQLQQAGGFAGYATPTTTEINNPALPYVPGSYQDPSTEPIRQDILGKLGTLQSAYNALFGQIDQSTQEQANQAQQGYDQQYGNLNTTYGNSTNSLENQYGARGLSSSSYKQNALNQAADTYQQNVAQIQQDRQNTLSQIQQKALAAKSPYQQQLAQYQALVPNLGQYGLTDLQSLQGTLGGAASSAGGLSAQYGPNSKFLSELGQLVPTVNQGANQLSQQLQQLVTSGAPIFAKKQIAAGLINNSKLQDQGAKDYWTNYFSQLLGQGG